MEMCDLCGKITSCIYLRDWGAWMCFNCYWGELKIDKIENKEIG